jgi:hypothetical protein
MLLYLLPCQDGLLKFGKGIHEETWQRTQCYNCTIVNIVYLMLNLLYFLLAIRTILDTLPYGVSAYGLSVWQKVCGRSYTNYIGIKEWALLCTIQWGWLGKSSWYLCQGSFLLICGYFVIHFLLLCCIKNWYISFLIVNKSKQPIYFKWCSIKNQLYICKFLKGPQMYLRYVKLCIELLQKSWYSHMVRGNFFLAYTLF